MTKHLSIVVDRELCEGNGVCVVAAPAVFDIDANDTLQLKEPQPSAAHLSQVEEAVRRCPKGALALQDS
jgi:ferredoxin